MTNTFSASAVRDILIHNAFNSFGDVTGSDDFGYSAAWLDLNDHLETPMGRALDPSEAEDLIEELGGRYLIVFLHASGIVEHNPYVSKRDMKDDFWKIEKDFFAWEDGLSPYDD